jgi:hypothetical protein
VISGRKRIFAVTLNGSLMPEHRLKVTMVQQGGTWKIDRVEGVYQ